MTGCSPATMLTAMELSVGLPRKGDTSRRPCACLPEDTAQLAEGINAGDIIIPTLASADFFKNFRLVMFFTDDQVPALNESEISSKEFRKNWARLIQKIYNVNPLLCPNLLNLLIGCSFV